MYMLRIVVRRKLSWKHQERLKFERKNEFDGCRLVKCTFQVREKQEQNHGGKKIQRT